MEGKAFGKWKATFQEQGDMLICSSKDPAGQLELELQINQTYNDQPSFSMIYSLSVQTN